MCAFAEFLQSCLTASSVETRNQKPETRNCYADFLSPIEA
jgi:hypothetical protein